jgi:ABC-2 type transport system permease protein
MDLKMCKYLTIFNLSFLHSLKNYKAIVGLSIFLITCLIIFAHLWKIAAAKTGVVDLDPAQLLWYIAFNEWILVSLPDTQDEMEQDLRSGRLAYLLPRPISYLGATFAEAVGTLTVNLLILGLVTFLFTWFQAGGIPFPPSGFIVTVILGFAAGLVSILFQMLIGLSAFWIQEVSPFYWVWEKLLFMFGGLMLPLAVYPQWMQTAAQFTPFPAILGQRSALAINFDFVSIFYVSASLVAWGALGILCLLFLYRKGLSILNIEGG